MQAKTYVADRILSLNSIVDYLAMRGHTFDDGKYGIKKCCCPLHNEDTPSFYIYPPDPSKGDPYPNFYCFGCKKGGNLISLRSKLEGVSYRQIVGEMASGLGISIDDQIEYVIDQIGKQSDEQRRVVDEMEDALLVVSRAVYQHLKFSDLPDDEFDRCEQLMRAMDEAVERRNWERVKMFTEYVPEFLGERAMKFREERDRRNDDAAKFYAKL